MDSLKKINGREVGTLSQNEFWLFEAACRENRATRVYEGPMGFAGKAKVKIYAQEPTRSFAPSR